jgi:endo-1,4-beta-D-glucanase Y
LEYLRGEVIMKLFLSLLVVFAVFFFACSEDNNPNPNSGSCQEGTILENGECKEVPPGGGDGIGAYAALPSNSDAGKVNEFYGQWIGTFYITNEEEFANNPSPTAREEFDPEKPTYIKAARIKAAYGGSSNGSKTASEAIGYGMILTSLMGDWERFDRLLAYSKFYRINYAALMKWDITGFGRGDGGSATDADIDIMASLFIAYEKTKDNKYLDDAIEIGASIYDYEIDAATRLVLPAMNDELMGRGWLFNISYISLPALGMLKKYDTSRDWASVLEANLSYMEMVQNNGDGLWPDWSDASGTPVNPNNSSSQALTASDGTRVNSHEAYNKEAVRIPWRIAWYYHWFGDPRAKAMLDKGMAFLRNKGVSTSQDLKVFYSYTGNKQSNTAAGASGWASLCALGLGDSANQEWMNGCNDRATDYYNPAVSSYYANSLQLIYAMLFNGKF